jgi:hypothetical protein
VSEYWATQDIGTHIAGLSTFRFFLTGSSGSSISFERMSALSVPVTLQKGGLSGKKDEQETKVRSKPSGAATVGPSSSVGTFSTSRILGGSVS